MKILCLADEESKVLWDFFSRSDFDGVDLIISCGDLKGSYLSYLTTLTSIPVLYVRGNHDDGYDRDPPEGCICIEDQVYEFQGIRILGLGGSQRYKPGANQYTEREMCRRVKSLRMRLALRKGIDILVTHSPARGVHDDEDLCHQGFEVFNTLIDTYQPKYFIHGHVHLNYGRQFPREDRIGETCVINAFEKYMIEF